MKARVFWEIDVEIEDGSVEDCAKDAFETVSKPGTESTVFVVLPDEGMPMQVDLFEGTAIEYIPTCQLQLAELDSAGTPNGTVLKNLPLASASDIISHARQLAVLFESRGSKDEAFNQCMAELTEAVSAANL